MGGCFGGLIVEPPTGGHWGYGSRAPSRWKILYFLQNGLNFRPILIKINALKLDEEVRNAKNLTKLVAEMGYVGGRYKW